MFERMCVFVSALMYLLIQAASAEFYAPYVHVKVTGCTVVQSNATMRQWTCTGLSSGGFAVSDDYNSLDMCTKYCTDVFTTLWTKWLPLSGGTPTVFLGGSPAALPPTLCVDTRVPYKCYSRVSSTTPVNDLSISLYAAPDAADYYFSTEANATCSPSVQCSAFRLLKETLYRSQAPRTDDISLVRGSRYSCVLSYIGAGGIGGADVCFEQLGPMCFRPANLTQFCVIGGSTPFGITNSGAESSGSMVMCTFDNEAKRRSVLYQVGPEYIPFGFASCASIVIDPETYVNTGSTFDIEYDPDMLSALRSFSMLFLNVPVSCDLVTTGTMITEMSAVMRNMAVTYNANGVVLDMSDISTTCFNTYDANVLIGTLAAELSAINVFNVIVKLPVNIAAMERVSISLQAITAAIIPTDKLSMGQLSSAVPTLSNTICQMSWESGNGYPGILEYMLKVVGPASKLIGGLSLTGYANTGTAWRAMGGSLTAGKVLMADAVNQDLKCSASGIGSTCCTGSNSVPSGGTTTSVNTAYVKLPDVVAITNMMNSYFGVNQFVVTNVDSDYMYGRESLPTLQQLLSSVKELVSFKSPYTAFNARSLDVGVLNGTSKMSRSASTFVVNSSPTGSADTSNSISPNYRVGSGPQLVCPGMIATVGSLYMSNIPYIEFSASNIFDQIYVADISTLISCTRGNPSNKLTITDKVPQYGIDINTISPSTKANAYIAGISITGELVEYIPPVQAVCQDVNDTPLDRLPYLIIDDQFVFSNLTIDEPNGIIVAPIGAHYVMSEFTYGVDYINFKSVCIDYDIDAMPSCGVTVCGGDLSCINTYGSVCNGASTIISDARRSGQIMRAAFDELAIEEKKAMIYADTEVARRRRRSLKKKPRIFGIIGLGVAIGSLVEARKAMALAKETARRVDYLEKQMDLTKNQIVELGNQLVTITNKLNANIEMTNQRIDELQDQTNQQFKVVNNNFQQLSSDLKALQSEVNTRFKVMFGYQTWYSQMISITTQLTQAAIQMNHKAVNVKMCLLNLADGIMGACPSGLDTFVEYPGLANVRTVEALLYTDRKLIIVNKFPKKIDALYFHKVFAIPTVSGGSVCWPDYDAIYVNGKYYRNPECETKFCKELQPYPEFEACVANPAKCNVVCGRCYKNICYDNGLYTWTTGTLSVSITADPPPVFERPSFENMTFPDLSLNFSDPEIIESLNTSVVLHDIREDLKNVTDSLIKYEEEYEALKALRRKTEVVDQTLLIVTMVWLGLLTLALIYIIWKGRAGGGGGRYAPSSTTVVTAPSAPASSGLGPLLGAVAALPIAPPQARIAAAAGSMLLGGGGGGDKRGKYAPLVNLE